MKWRGPAWALGLLVALGGPAGGAAAEPTKKGAGTGQVKSKARARAAAKRVNLGSAQGFARKGQDALAAIVYRQQLKADPDSAAAHVGLGRSLARRGQCEEGLLHLEPYEGTTPFTSEAALLAGVCFDRFGYPGESVHFSRLATELSPNDPKTWTSLVLALDRAGDGTGAAEAMERLWTLGDDTDDHSLFAEAALALRRGDIDTFDVLADQFRRERGGEGDLHRLAAQSWLDLDDPEEALLALKSGRAMNRSTQEQVIRAEAHRRLGETDTATWTLARRVGNPLDGAPADAVRARAWVDAGRLPEAAALLAGYAGGLDEDIVAARWYVARAVGDVAAQAEAAAEYATVRTSPLRTLEQLVPVTAR